LSGGKAAPEQVEDNKLVKQLDAIEIYAQIYGDDAADFKTNVYQKGGKVDIRRLGQWDSRKCALALYSVNQDVIMEELQERFDLQASASWSAVRDLCLPVWLKDSHKLRLVADWISKVAYKIAAAEASRKLGDGSKAQSKAEATSLWYILINKKSVLINLYEKEQAQGGDKVAQLLSQDYTVERQQKIACKNALKLRGLQRYLLCASLFILGNDLKSALQVIVASMKDPMLAIVTCRLLQLQRPNDATIQEELDKLYQEHFVERGKLYGDLYLQSMGLWGQKKYVQAVNALEARWDAEGKKQCLGADEMFEPSEGTIAVVKAWASDRPDQVAPKVRKDAEEEVLTRPLLSE